MELGNRLKTRENEEAEKETKKAEETKPVENSGDGNKPKTNTLVDDTNLAAKRLEEATASAKEERLAREESYSKMKLSGQAEAGQVAKEKKETDEEFTARVEAGQVDLTAR